MIGVIAFIFMMIFLPLAGMEDERADSTKTNYDLYIEKADSNFDDWLCEYYLHWLQENFIILNDSNHIKIKYDGYQIDEGTIIYIKDEK